MNIRTYLAIVAFLTSFAMPLATQAGVYDEILFAANQNDTDKVVGLLRRGMDVNTADVQGTTLLMIAARGANIELVRFLLDNRANAQRRNQYGDTALMLATLMGHKDVVHLMMERKVEINHAGWNALHYAAFEGRSEIVALLIAGGADVNLKAPNAHTALMLSAKRGHLETVRLLVGASADVTLKDPEGGSARDMALKAGQTDIAIFLEKSGG
jgi:ankyrin repeat protein